VHFGERLVAFSLLQLRLRKRPRISRIEPLATGSSPAASLGAAFQAGGEVVAVIGGEALATVNHRIRPGGRPRPRGGEFGLEGVGGVQRADRGLGDVVALGAGVRRVDGGRAGAEGCEDLAGHGGARLGRVRMTGADDVVVWLDAFEAGKSAAPSPNRFAPRPRAAPDATCELPVAALYCA
jgi:hypothetical protein